LLFPACALIAVLSPVVVGDILGKKWDGTVPLIQILALGAMIALLSDVTVPLVKGFGQSYRVTQIELVQSLALVLTIWFFTEFYGTVGTALAWLPAIILVQILCLYFIRDIFSHVLDEVRKPVLAIFGATGVCAAISFLTIRALPNIAGLIVSVVLAILGTGSVLWYLDSRYSLGLSRNIAVAFPQVASLLRTQPQDLS